MRIISKSIAASLCIVSFFSSCQKNDIDKTTSEPIHVSIQTSSVETKTYLDNNLDGTYTVGWSASDKLTVFTNAEPTDGSTKYEFINTAGDGVTANFEGDINEHEGTFLSVYPSEKFVKVYNTDHTVGMTVEAIQHPTYDSFDKNCDILVGKPIAYSADDYNSVSAHIAFARPLSILKINLNSAFKGIQDEEVVNFRIDADEILTGRVALNLNDASIKTWNVKNKYVSAQFDNHDVKINTELENTVYLVVNPTTLSAGSTLKFTIETSSYYVEKTIESLPKDIVLPSGNIAVINLSIAESNCVSKAQTQSLPYIEDFTKSQGSFTIDNVDISDLSYVWAQTSYGMKASSYVSGTRYATESWLISPKIDLKESTGAILSFAQMLNYLSGEEREDFVETMIKVGESDWAILNIDQYPVGNSNDFVTSSANLFPYVGNEIQLGFRYTSTSSVAPTWEIKSLSVVVPETTLELNTPTVSVYEGATVSNPATTNSPATITYTSSNDEIATVDENGTITGVSEGNCTITATVPAEQGYSAKSVTCEVTVMPKGKAWVKTALSEITPNAKVVIVGSGHAISNDNGTASAPAAISVEALGNSLNSVVSDNMVWHIGGNATDGYTFYAAADYSSWLYCSTTASSSNNNCLKVGTGDRKSFIANGSGIFVTNDTYTARFISLYNNQDWRGYVNTSNGACALDFYVEEGSNTGGVIRKDASLTLSQTSVSIKDNETSDITFETDYDGALSVASDDETVATVALNGDVITVTGVKEGTTTLTISGPETSKFNAVTKTISVTITGQSQGGGETPTTITKTISSMSGSPTDGTYVETMTLDSNIEATAPKVGNNGKVYSSGAQWRLYEQNGGKMIITAKNGYSLQSVTVTFTVSNTGKISYNGTALTSGTAVTVSGTSAEFVIGNTGTATNGQVRVTEISVTYSK